MDYNTRFWSQIYLNQEKKPYINKAAELKVEYEKTLDEVKNADNKNEEVVILGGSKV